MGINMFYITMFCQIMFIFLYYLIIGNNTIKKKNVILRSKRKEIYRAHVFSIILGDLPALLTKIRYKLFKEIILTL